MITPEQAAVMMPVLKGILAGNIIEFDPAPGPYMVTPDGRRREVESNRDGEDSGSEQYVYVTYLRGTMLKHDGVCGEPGTRTIGKNLLDADGDPTVVGHIIVAESGGGACNSVAEIADAITKCAKPVVTYIDGVAGSACMYAISYSDHIMAHKPMDEVGCIGVMVQLSGLPRYHRNPETGEIYCRVYATESDEKNLDYEAALEGDAQIIREGTLDPLCRQFMEDIRANRPAVTEDQLHGRTFFAKDVIGSLVDSIGTFEDAVAKVIELAEARDAANTSEQMTQYPTLESIPSLQEQQYEQDGSTVLQRCQLEAIEQALSAPRAEETALQARLDSLAETHRAEVDSLNQTILRLQDSLSGADARIAELESSLEAAIARADEEHPAAVAGNADPTNETNAGARPAKTYAEAIDACKAFLNRE